MGHAEYLKSTYKNKENLAETNLEGLEPTNEYIGFNQVKKLNYSAYSFKQLIENNAFDFKNGIIINGSQRYFILEVSAVYLLEKELADCSAELYSSAFDSGKQIMETTTFDKSLKTVSDLLSAFGCGDVLILKNSGKYTINFNYFPFSKFCKEIKFDFMRGLVSGMLSAVKNKEINFKSAKITLTQGYLSLSLIG